MGEVINVIGRALGSVFVSYFASDMDVISDEGKRILSDDKDRVQYMEAIEKLRSSADKEEVITLSNQEKVTLVS